jgi:tetratricopeptide (TPR) repeat protein
VLQQKHADRSLTYTAMTDANLSRFFSCGGPVEDGTGLSAGRTSYANRCLVREVVGQLDKALDYCNRALKTAPGLPIAHESKGLVYLRMKRPDLALAEYDAVLAKVPKRAIARYGKALDLEMKGDKAKSDSERAAAVALDPAVGLEFSRYGVN